MFLPFLFSFQSCKALLQREHRLLQFSNLFCGGLLFDLIGDYQYIFAWDFLFTVLAFLCFVKLYRDWQKRGGRRSYVAPVYRK